MPTWREIKGAYGRGRRALRRAMLEPLLVGRPVLRDTVMHALAARGHFVFCDLGDARFFVDPSDRVVGAWLMWHGGWQRREIDQAVAVLAASGRLRAGGGLRRCRRQYRHAHGLRAADRTLRARGRVRAGAEERALLAHEPRGQWARGPRHRGREGRGRSGRAPRRCYLHPRNKGAHAIGAPPSDDGLDRLEVPVVRRGRRARRARLDGAGRSA